MSPELDCLSCGACCFDNDVVLTPADAERFEAVSALNALAYRVVERPGLELVLLRRDVATGRCLALGGKLGACRCLIYGQRPHLCRAFHVGSPECWDSRRRHGIETTASE